MKIASLDLAQQTVVQNNNGMLNYLKNLERGRASTPRAWLYEDRDPMEVVHEWIKTYLKPLSQTGRTGKLVYQFDISKLKKCQPQGEVKPISEIMDIVTAGFNQADSPMPKVYKTREWQLAKEMAIDYLFRETKIYHTLRPRAYEHVVDDMRSRDTLDSNSGWPDFSRRNDPSVLASAIADIKNGKYLTYPAIVLFRNYKAKTRMVWMYPMSANIKEGSFTQPLKEAFLASKLDFFAPWRGYEHVLSAITDSYDSGNYLAASDFSHTDEFFTKYDTLEVYDVIKHGFQEQYWDELKQSMLYVNSIPLVVGTDRIIYGDHGVSSGSNWTNDMETYYDLIWEFMFKILKLVSNVCNAIGDDVIHERHTYLKQLAAELAEWYKKANKDVNESKVTNEEDYVIYLQRLTIRDYRSERTFTDIHDNQRVLLRGIYSSVWALYSSMQPEKFHSPKMMRRFGLKAKDMSASRLFMIAENLIDHPLFVDYVKFMCKGNPYLVKFAHKTDNELNEITEKSHHLPGFNPTYNQEKRDKGLADFESIRIAREL